MPFSHTLVVSTPVESKLSTASMSPCSQHRTRSTAVQATFSVDGTRPAMAIAQVPYLSCKELQNLAYPVSRVPSTTTAALAGCPHFIDTHTFVRRVQSARHPWKQPCCAWPRCTVCHRPHSFVLKRVRTFICGLRGASKDLLLRAAACPCDQPANEVHMFGQAWVQRTLCRLSPW